MILHYGNTRGIRCESLIDCISGDSCAGCSAFLPPSMTLAYHRGQYYFYLSFKKICVFVTVSIFGLTLYSIDSGVK